MKKLKGLLYNKNKMRKFQPGGQTPLMLQGPNPGQQQAPAKNTDTRGYWPVAAALTAAGPGQVAYQYLKGRPQAVTPAAGGGMAPAAGAMLGALPVGAALSHMDEHYADIQRNMNDPQYDTQSKTSDYTQNPYPGQQAGTGQNTGTKPEYNEGFRYDLLTHQPTYHDLGGPRDRSNTPGWSPNGDPYQAEDLSSKLSGFFGAPVRALINAGFGRYNAVRDYMEAKPEGEKSAEMTKGGGQSTQEAPTQGGYIQRQNLDRTKTTPVKRNEWTQEDQQFLDSLGVNAGDKESIKKLQSVLLNANIDLGGFGNGGLDGIMGNYTRGGIRKLREAMTDPEARKALISNSPYLKQMQIERFRGGIGPGATQADMDNMLTHDIASAIYNADPNSWNPDLATGNITRKGKGKGGQTQDVNAAQQRSGTSDSDANQGFSNQGVKEYRGKDNKTKKTTKSQDQGSSTKKKKFGGKFGSLMNVKKAKFRKR